MKKALVLYSGGLDSRLVIKILQEQNYETEAIHFILPFGCNGHNLLKGLNTTEVKLTTFNAKKDPLLSEYLNIIKNPKHGTGTGINPCKDCKIFMFKKAKQYADKNNIEIIATGEVVGQRPMSQTSSALKIIDDKIKFKISRPLIDLKISGRSRKKQMRLAEKYKIEYPSSGGGCLLCEKIPSLRIKHLIEKNLINEKTLKLSTIGRHFYINNTWLVVARDAKESEIITKLPNKNKTFTEISNSKGMPHATRNHIPDNYGKPAIYYSNPKEKETALKLQEAYSTGDNEEKRNKFNKYKLDKLIN